jgi:lysylphosphatidylglycerol synthetase-like protein (DUF2156 family)
VPPVRRLPPGYTITYPNRGRASSKALKLIVVLILLISVVLMLAVTFGGWSKLQGLTFVNLIWCFIYLVIAYYVARWARGLLPIAAALAILLMIISLIAGLGASGTSWFSRSHFGFSAAQSIFGGSGLSADTLGLLTLLIAPVQLLLIIFAMLGFSQGWNVEVEAPIDDLRHRGRTGSGASSSSAGSAPAAA